MLLRQLKARISGLADLYHRVAYPVYIPDADPILQHPRASGFRQRRIRHLFAQGVFPIRIMLEGVRAHRLIHAAVIDEIGLTIPSKFNELRNKGPSTGRL